MILVRKFLLTLSVAELEEYLAPLKISPSGWNKALQFLILNGALLALEVWINAGMSSQLLCRISQRMWNAAYAIFMLLYGVYSCYGMAEIFRTSKKPACMYSNVLNKWFYIHTA